MKTLSLSLLILATVFMVTGALPEDKKKDRHGLVDSESSKGNEEPLQRRKPPGKVPGPKLTPEEFSFDSLTGHKPEMKPLSDDDGGKKKKKKDVNLTKDNKKNKKDSMAPLENDSKDEKGKKGQGNKSKNLVGGRNWH